MDAGFWSALGAIIVINLVLSGDNAVVIAMACKNLPVEQRKWGIIWGTAGAVFFRVILTFFAAYLLQFSYLKIVGGLLLLAIAIHLLVDDEGEEIEAKSSLKEAITTIILADVVMSLDNVLGIAAIAGDNLLLLILGLLISIPIVVFGATIILKLLDRFPIIIWIGAAILGYVAGEMFVTDNATVDYFAANPTFGTLMPWLAVAFTVAAGVVINKMRGGDKKEGASAEEIEAQMAALKADGPADSVAEQMPGGEPENKD